MTDERQQAAWLHTATIRADIANLFREKGKRPAKPEDFDPYASSRKLQARRNGHLRRKPNRPMVPVSTLRDVFCKRPASRATRAVPGSNRNG